MLKDFHNLSPIHACALAVSLCVALLITANFLTTLLYGRVPEKPFDAIHYCLTGTTEKANSASCRAIISERE